MTTFESFNAAPAPVSRGRSRGLYLIRDRAIAGLPVLALVILAVALFYLRIRLFLPL
jgi:hypothetical protein